MQNYCLRRPGDSAAALVLPLTLSFSVDEPADVAESFWAVGAGAPLRGFLAVAFVAGETGHAALLRRVNVALQKAVG